MPGLLLQITKTGSRSWVLRTTVGARRREIGLGQYPAIGLALAREKAQAARDQIKDGIDPVEVRAAARRSLIQQQHTAKTLAWTFQRSTEKYIEAMPPGWRNAKHELSVAAIRKRRENVQAACSPTARRMRVTLLQSRTGDDRLTPPHFDQLEAGKDKVVLHPFR